MSGNHDRTALTLVLSSTCYRDNAYQLALLQP